MRTDSGPSIPLGFPWAQAGDNGLRTVRRGFVENALIDRSRLSAAQASKSSPSRRRPPRPARQRRPRAQPLQSRRHSTSRRPLRRKTPTTALAYWSPAVSRLVLRRTGKRGRSSRRAMDRAAARMARGLRLRRAISPGPLASWPARARATGAARTAYQADPDRPAARSWVPVTMMPARALRRQIKLA